MLVGCHGDWVSTRIAKEVAGPCLRNMCVCCDLEILVSGPVGKICIKTQGFDRGISVNMYKIRNHTV